MANLKDLIVNGSARILGTIYGNLTGNVTGNCSGSSGSCTGNAATATKATQDASGNVITSTYVNLTGAQTISGAKTFSSTITGSVSGSSGSCTGTAAKATADASGNTITSYYQPKLAATGSASVPVYVSSAGTLSTCNTIPSTTASVTSGSTAALTSGGAYTALSGKQATLVSGTNIKTINSNSILGSGNLELDGLPSQSGQSGKYLTTDGTDASWATLSTYHPDIFSFQWCDHLLNNVSWLRGDTFSWQSGSVYVTAYNTLVSEYNDESSVEETEGDITFKRTTNGYKIATADYEEAILEKYNTDGIAWYYILDTTNTRFKLPRMKHKYWINQSTLPVKGTGMALGLTNGTYNLTLNVNSSSGNSDTFGTDTYGEAVGTIFTTTCSTPNKSAIGVTTDSTKSGVVADVSSSVEETGFYLYFYVGEYSQTAIEQTAGITSEQLNAKVDNSSLVETQVIIDTYIDGTSGYRIWSDGYCEQWGNASSSDTITLLKTFANTNFSVLGVWQQTTDDLYERALSLYTKTVSSLIFRCGYYGNAMVTFSGYPFNWRASGYLASDQY